MNQQPQSPESGSTTTLVPTGSGRRLINATAVMASGTMISRVLGLVRAMLIAFILGNGTMRADVLSLALTVPSSLYLLLAGGTLNNVLVPQIVRAVNHDDDGGKAFVDRIMTGFLIVLGSLTVVFTVAAPWVMSIYTKSVWRTEDMAESWRSLLLMSYITMPQVFFYGVFFLIGQVLNAREKFGPMMWAPILNNVVSIVSLSMYLVIWGAQSANGLAFTDQQVWLLGIGSTLGIIAQTVLLVPFLKAAGFTYRPRFDLKGTGLGQTFHVAKWMVGFVALTSIAQVVVTNLASGGVSTGAGSGGGVNAYQNAYLIWILPHSLLTVSLATAMLPSASAYAQSGNRSGVAAEVNRAMRLALTFLVPASVAFIVLADPITRVPFGNGVGAEDYRFVAWALMAFGIGLVPYTIQYLYLRAFYALDNTKTPFLLQIAISGANAALAIAFVTPWESPATVAARLALAYSASYFIGVFITHRSLRKRLPELDGRQTWRHLTRLLVAAIPAAILAWLITWSVAGSASVWVRLGGLAVAGVAAVLVFFFAAKRLNIPEAASLLGMLRRRGDDGDSDAVETIVEDAAAADQAQPPAPQSGTNQPSEINNDDPDGGGVFIPAQPATASTEVLQYPEPASAVFAGPVLGDRYQLAERLGVHERAQTWRAHDSVLGRPVLVHLFSVGDSRTAKVLTAARSAAAATDSRFLRVLDVVDSEGGVGAKAGAYIVYEYVAGQTMAQLLLSGPLTSVETAWVVREVSDALSPLHSHGYFHRYLNPATVLISNSGNVKIMGFEVDAAMHGVERASSPQAVDVQALGDLIYAGLVAHWPHGSQFGLPGAPTEAGRAVPPSQVRGGVAPALDHLVDRICSPTPRSRASRLTTAQAITTELSLVLGATSAAQDLRARLDPPSGEFVEAAPVGSAVIPPMPTPASEHTTAVSSQISAEVEPDAPFVDAALAHGDQFTPVPPPMAGLSHKRPLPLLTVFSVVVVAVGLIAASLLTIRPADTGRGAALAISGVDDFDPKADGGSGGENASKAHRVADGDLTTVWLTEKYRASNFSAKPGLGVVLDLGMVHEVDSVRTNLVGLGTDLEIRIPAGNVASSPTKTVRDWRIVAAAKNATEVAEMTLTEPVRTRYVMVYLTALPAVGNSKYQGGIAEIQVLGD